MRCQHEPHIVSGIIDIEVVTYTTTENMDGHLTDIKVIWENMDNIDNIEMPGRLSWSTWI
jgi:hypothetical protein